MPPDNENRGTYVPMGKLKLKKYSSDPLIWGAKINKRERDVVKDVAIQILANPNDLMACMAWEGAREFSPATRNFAGSSATGMIQIMVDTVRTTPEILNYCKEKIPKTFIAKSNQKQIARKAMEVIAGMSFEEYMYKVALVYFRPYRGRIYTLCDLYMSILYPRAMGKPDNYVMFVNNLERHRDAYDMNYGLDKNKDNKITKYEACYPVRNEYRIGMKYTK